MGRCCCLFVCWVVVVVVWQGEGEAIQGLFMDITTTQPPPTQPPCQGQGPTKRTHAPVGPLVKEPFRRADAVLGQESLVEHAVVVGQGRQTRGAHLFGWLVGRLVGWLVGSEGVCGVCEWVCGWGWWRR